MQPPMIDCAERSPTDTWKTLARHQLGAVAATGLDFGSMVLWVEYAGVSPTAAAALGASVGGVTNFLLGRAWVFRPRDHAPGRWTGQAFRYALVSATSAGLNALGEYLVHDFAHVEYVLARAFVSLGVSLLWNFPMQRGFVFRHRSSSP
jgi:putative flippase GtrA